jgi:hypothetical protein
MAIARMRVVAATILRAWVATAISRTTAATPLVTTTDATTIVRTCRQIPAGWPVVAIGLAIGVLLFTGFAIQPGPMSPVTTDDLVLASIAEAPPDKPTAAAPGPEKQAAAEPPLRRVEAPPVPATLPKEPRQAITTPKSVPRQVARVAPARDVRGTGGRRSPPQVHRGSASTARKPAPAESTAHNASPALPRFRGSLVVHSDPVGAVVWVDGRVVGATPLLLKEVPAGSRVVRIESQGYERWSFAARVVANQELRIVATLQPASDQ